MARVCVCQTEFLGGIAASLSLRKRVSVANWLAQIRISLKITNTPQHFPCQVIIIIKICKMYIQNDCFKIVMEWRMREGKCVYVCVRESKREVQF